MSSDAVDDDDLVLDDRERDARARAARLGATLFPASVSRDASRRVRALDRGTTRARTTRRITRENVRGRAGEVGETRAIERDVTVRHLHAQ